MKFNVEEYFKGNYVAYDVDGNKFKIIKSDDDIVAIKIATGLVYIYDDNLKNFKDNNGCAQLIFMDEPEPLLTGFQTFVRDIVNARKPEVPLTPKDTVSFCKLILDKINVEIGLLPIDEGSLKWKNVLDFCMTEKRPDGNCWANQDLLVRFTAYVDKSMNKITDYGIIHSSEIVRDRTMDAIPLHSLINIIDNLNNKTEDK